RLYQLLTQESRKSMLFGIDGPSPSSAAIRDGLFAEKLPLPDPYHEQHPVSWSLKYGGPTNLLAPVVTLSSPIGYAFPVVDPGWMGVAGSGPQCRTEPLSNAQLPEWDLLVTGGNLAAAPGPQDVTRLLAAEHTPGFLGSILGLAGAYAAYAA